MAININRAKKMLEFSIAAYTEERALLSNQVQSISMRASPFLGDRGEIKVIRMNNQLYDSECFIVHNGKGDIVIAFRGTETSLFSHDGAFRDWVTTDFDAHPIRYPLDPGPMISLNRGRWVHRGFWNAYDLVRADIHSTVRKLLRQHKNDDVRIFTTGHSLGGALAIHAGADLGSRFIRLPVYTYTFAAPRVGNDDFNALFEDNTREAFLFVFRGDPVPFTPPIGPNIKLRNKRYRTARSVVYINRRYECHSRLPIGRLNVRMKDHYKESYRDALERI